jgi:hypothetical protein
MVRSIKDVLGNSVEAIDGSIGDIHDVYFDDHEWTVRYYVVDTGKWLPGRKVLIPAHAVRHAMRGDTGFPVDLTREQVRTSPDVDMHRPVSRQAELILYRHYGWAPYWFPIAPASPVVVDGNAEEREREATSGYYGEPNLRSAKEVTGYHVAASDGEIGHIDDFLVDDENAAIRYAVVDTRNWLPGRHVLIAPNWVKEIKWSEGKVFVKATREMVRSSPEYNPAAPLSREYESQLSEHYGYPIELL